MLMNAPSELRAEFIARITRGDTPHYKVTFEGDPVRQRRLRRRLPNIYTAHKIVDRQGDSQC